MRFKSGDKWPEIKIMVPLLKNRFLVHIKVIVFTMLCGVLLSCDKETLYINLPVYGPDQEFFALASNNVLTLYNASDVRSAGTSVTISGLAAGERMMDIDFRPATGELYGISTSSKVYIINTTTGTTLSVADAGLSTAVTGNIVNIDFNPVVDLLRIVTSSGQNLRVNPETGVLVGTDGNVSSNNIAGIAYSNNFSGTTSTVLYDIDPVAGKLYQQAPPNNGTLVAVGDLNIALGNRPCFDIAPNNENAFAIGKLGDSTKLYTVNLTTAKLTLAGKFRAGTDIRSIAIPTAPVAYAVDQSSNLLTFNPTLSAPTAAVKRITGLATGESILGLDMRPLNGQLYALGSTSRLYTINIGTAVATQVGTGTFSTPLSGTSFGFDFNPLTKLIRVVSNTRQVLNIDPTTVAITVGTSITPTTATLSAAAFDNNFRTSTATALYVIDDTANKLFSLNVTTGVLTEIGDLTVNVTGTNGFDISSANIGFAALNNGTKTSLYTINLSTGQAVPRFDFPSEITAFTLSLN